MKIGALHCVAVIAAGVSLCSIHAGESAEITPGAIVGPPAPPDQTAIDSAVREGIAFLISAQEGSPKAQWPYEGVYRVGGEIPVGYRIGGTGIVGDLNRFSGE